MTRCHRFGLRDICFELETDLEPLLEFWIGFTARFPAAGEPAVRYRALSSGGPRFTGSSGIERRAERTADLFPLLEGEFLDDLQRLTVPGETIVHAAGGAIGGRATVYLGASGAGKSTLSVELVREGQVFLGDDTLILDGGEVVALPRPISFAAHEQPAALLPEGDERFDALGYDYVDRAGDQRRALFFLPREPLVATAGDRFVLERVVLLERGADGPPRRRLLSGPELRARLALARVGGGP